ncbi:hypothetical protein GGR57DRAFT_451702 [Xylariaceae sp. FL1272]|nr:hypothetical protein GGR57DRAFT_451702 [Xylariaceae sp. FL1272]
MPRLPDSKHSRKAATSLVNRRRGICKKSNTLKRMHGVEIGVFMKDKDGYVIRYESTPGILCEASRTRPDESYSPDDFDTVTDRRGSPTLSPTAIPALTSQFFETEDCMGSLLDMAGAFYGSPPLPLDQATLASTVTAAPTYQGAQTPSSPDLGQEQRSGDNGTQTTAYMFPSTLLPSLPIGAGSCVSTSSAAASLRSSSPPPQDSVSSQFSPSEWDSVGYETDSIANQEAPSPRLQNDVLSVLDGYIED